MLGFFEFNIRKYYIIDKMIAKSSSFNKRQYNIYSILIIINITAFTCCTATNREIKNSAPQFKERRKLVYV